MKSMVMTLLCVLLIGVAFGATFEAPTTARIEAKFVNDTDVKIKFIDFNPIKLKELEQYRLESIKRYAIVAEDSSCYSVVVPVYQATQKGFGLLGNRFNVTSDKKLYLQVGEDTINLPMEGVELCSPPASNPGQGYCLKITAMPPWKNEKNNNTNKKEDK